jgi:hypothetical protein
MAELSEHDRAIIKLLQRDPKKEAAYYEEFGRFIAAYSSAEAEIHAVARHFSGTDDTRARVIFGGLRISDAIDRLRALLRFRDGSVLGLFNAGPTHRILFAAIPDNWPATR